MHYARKIVFDHSGPEIFQIKVIDRFSDKNRVNSRNFNATILISEKFHHPVSHVFLFGNMFPESRGFVAMPVTSCIKDTCSNVSQSNLWRETKLFDIVTDTATKPRLSGKHVTKYKNMRQWMVKFLRKFENRGNKIARFNSILIIKSINVL